MLGLTNIPELLGFRSEIQVMKRRGDQADAWLAALLALLGLLLYSASFSGPKLACVPVECPTSPLNPKCALDWSYQSHQCEEELLSYPDAGFHLLLLMKGALFLSILILPIFYGNKACTDQFTSISSLWKLRGNTPATGRVEWRRRMHLALEQLKASTLLTRHYSLYHTLGLALDSISLTISLLYSLHFLDYRPAQSRYREDILGLATFLQPSNTLCQNGTFHCEVPHLFLYKWFGLLGSLLIAIKVANRCLCLGFSLGLPGLFGRTVLLHCSRLTDVHGELVYRLESRPGAALRAAAARLASLALLGPLRAIAAYCDFYFYTAGCKTAITFSADDEAEEPGEEGAAAAGAGSEESFLAAAAAATERGRRGGCAGPGPRGCAGPREGRGRHLPAGGLQNWADLFFVLDVMSGSIDICEILIFLSKTEPLVPGLEGKRVDPARSHLDTRNNRLSLAFTHAGPLERLMEQEVAGGLAVRGWLEGPRGRVEAEPVPGEPGLVFSVDLGSSYELVSAVFARGRQLARLPPYKVSLPGELRLRMRKTPGSRLPLSSLAPLQRRSASR